MEIDKDADWKQIVSYFTIEATDENNVYIIEERMKPYLVRINKIDDEDDDVISSSNEFNNKKDMDYDFTVETYNGSYVMQ